MRSISIGDLREFDRGSGGARRSLREYEKLARQCATDGLDHVQLLARLVEMNMIDRNRRLVERRIGQARFPVVKQLGSFDFKAIPSLNKMFILDLSRGDYIDLRETAILLGPSGLRKDAQHSRPRRRRLDYGDKLPPMHVMHFPPAALVHNPAAVDNLVKRCMCKRIQKDPRRPQLEQL